MRFSVFHFKSISAIFKKRQRKNLRHELVNVKSFEWKFLIIFKVIFSFLQKKSFDSIEGFD
jgi:hypothetical protein